MTIISSITQNDKRNKIIVANAIQKQILGHCCEEKSLYYCKIVNGKEVEISNLKYEITSSLKSKFDDDEVMLKILLALILCFQHKWDEGRVLQEETTSQNEKPQEPNVTYILPL